MTCGDVGWIVRLFGCLFYDLHIVFRGIWVFTIARVRNRCCWSRVVQLCWGAKRHLEKVAKGWQRPEGDYKLHHFWPVSISAKIMLGLFRNRRIYKTLKAASPFPPILLRRDEHGHGWLWNGYGWRLEQLGLGWRMGRSLSCCSFSGATWIFHGFSWMQRLSWGHEGRRMFAPESFNVQKHCAFGCKIALKTDRCKSWGSPAKKLRGQR